NAFVIADEQSQTVDYSLKSELLGLRISTKPYSYQLVELSTGRVLISQFNSNFRINDTGYDVGNARIEDKTDSSINAVLHFKDSDRTANVKFEFTSDDILEVLLSCDESVNIKESFNDQSENYYGLWEYPKGGAIDNRRANAEMIGFRELPGSNYCNARAPFYITSRNYSIYAETMAKGRYSIANTGITSFAFDTGSLKYHIIYGQTYGRMLEIYNHLAGPSVMPPDWAFASIWWRDDHHEDFAPHVTNAQENVLDDAEQLIKHRIPASVIWIDRPYTSGKRGWGNMDFDDSFPEPKVMIDTLNEKGYQLLLWVTNRCINTLYDEGMKKGYLFAGYTSWPAADMRNPDAYNWFKNHLDTFVKMGVKGYKVDRGEEAEMPDSVQNENTYLFMKMVSEGQRQRHGNNHLIFARSAFDKSRKYVGIWNGDTDSNFDGLAISVKNGLRCGAINFPMYGSDTGGYLGPNVSKELFARWLGFSAYCPMMETLIGPNRTIWYDYDDELIDITRKHCTAHHELIPYTRSYMYQAVQTGMPVMRQLIFAYPDDEKLVDMFDEYLYGRDILVAPVLKEGQTGRAVYLPKGKWLNYNDKKTVYAGPAAIKADAPLDTIPLFVKAGAIIPRGDILKANNSWTQNYKPYLSIEIFPYKGDSSFSYYTGDSVKMINTSLAEGTLTVAFDNLGINGNIQIYCKDFEKIKLNGEELTAGQSFTWSKQSGLLDIAYNGKTSLVVTGVKSIFE
ncbi:MAG: TIM-barrel domain-containing protein, partial [Phycisphaerae bacterium]